MVVFVMVWYQSILPICFRVTSLTLKKACICVPVKWLWGISIGSYIQPLRTKPLTISMLNCLNDHERYIHISYHILDCVQQKKATFTIEQPYILPILYCQYHSYWCPGDVKSQGSRHGIDQISQSNKINKTTQRNKMHIYINWIHCIFVNKIRQSPKLFVLVWKIQIKSQNFM